MKQKKMKSKKQKFGWNKNNVKVSFYPYGVRHFDVNAKEGTITCQLSGWVKIPYCKELDIIPGFWVVGTGKAQTCGDDVFDENRGKRIALAKAENAVYNKALASLVKMSTAADDFKRFIKDFEKRTESHNKHNEDFIDRLSSPANPNYEKVVTPFK